MGALCCDLITVNNDVWRRRIPITVFVVLAGSTDGVSGFSYMSSAITFRFPVKSTELEGFNIFSFVFYFSVVCRLH